LLTLFKEMIAVYCENHTKHINTLCGQTEEKLIVKAHGTYNYHDVLRNTSQAGSPLGTTGVSGSSMTLRHANRCPRFPRRPLLKPKVAVRQLALVNAIREALGSDLRTKTGYNKFSVVLLRHNRQMPG
jgi:hypothetical protein